MKTIIVSCPTLRRAFYEWHRLADNYPDIWINVCRKPMSLTSKYGVKYIFRSENEIHELKGFRGDIIAVDDLLLVEPQESEDKE